MNEKVTDAQAVDLLVFLRTDASVDAKVAQINIAKSGIKHNNVPEAAVAPLFETTRTSMVSQHAALVNAGFSTLNHLLERLVRQEPKYIAKETVRTLPLVIEKLGDHKEKYRIIAAQCLITFWRVSPAEVERTVRDTAMRGKNPRAKEASLHWLVQMHAENGLQFRAFVPALMELLEDADGMVRDGARNAVIELFQHAPSAAKADLKKQLKAFNVRQTIVNAIVSQLGPAGPVDNGAGATDAPFTGSRSNFGDSVTSQASVRPSTPTLEPKSEHVEPLYVDSHRDLEDIFREMHTYFEGKESEQNWLNREKSCTKLRKLNAGNAPTDFHDVWLPSIKALLDGILKAVNSLRTSLSKEGCSLVQELARVSGPGLDPMVEILLQNLIKLCGGTKKIASQSGDATVDVILSKVSYNLRIIQHIWLACQDKNVQPRMYAAGWLKTLLKKEAHHKNHVEHTGGVDLIHKCIKKGLEDPNPGVREKMRGTYWAYAEIWPSGAEAIMHDLAPAQQKLLENDPSNPNSPKKAEAVVVRPGLGFSKSTTGPPKPSLRETMLAQKKAAMAAQANLPLRPGSAMSSFSPVRTASASSTTSTSSNASAVRARPEPTSTISHGGLSVAPMRPTKPRPRPELTRPATAGPYSVRKPAHAPSTSVESAATSPSATRARHAAPGVAPTSPKKVNSRPNTSHSSQAPPFSHTSPPRDKPAISRIPISPRHSPKSSRNANAYAKSPSRADEELTMVIPSVSSMRGFEAEANSTPEAPADDLHDRAPRPMKVYEDSPKSDHTTTPRPKFSPSVLEEVPINEDAANLSRPVSERIDIELGPDRAKQNTRLLDSGISRVKAKSLDLQGFRKLQNMIKEGKIPWADNRFEALIVGLFEYLESPLPTLTPEKAQDVKVQTLATLRLMLRKDREAFEPHVAQGLQSLLVARSAYDARAHIVANLDGLADDLVLLAEPEETATTIIELLQAQEMSTEGCRMLSKGLHVLEQLLHAAVELVPTDRETEKMSQLAMRCLDSPESAVRMGAIQLCVAMHGRVGEKRFWMCMNGIKSDPKNLITYYIVKRQREVESA